MPGVSGCAKTTRRSQGSSSISGPDAMATAAAPTQGHAPPNQAPRSSQRPAASRISFPSARHDAHGGGWASPVAAWVAGTTQRRHPPAAEVGERTKKTPGNTAGLDSCDSRRDNNPPDQPWETAQSNPAPMPRRRCCSPSDRCRSSPRRGNLAACGRGVEHRRRCPSGRSKTSVAPADAARRRSGREMAQAGWWASTGRQARGSGPSDPAGARRLCLGTTPRAKAMEALLRSATSMEPVRILLLDRNERRAKTLTGSTKVVRLVQPQTIYAQPMASRWTLTGT